VYDREVWETSGHWEKFRDNMYLLEWEGREYGLKPMNCPGHCLVFGESVWSYRDLPIRYAEAGTLHRNERSGTLHGLLRVRHVTQDDGHIFCAQDQIEAEVLGCLAYGFAVYERFGLDMRVELSTRPENRLGTD